VGYMSKDFNPESDAKFPFGMFLKFSVVVLVITLLVIFIVYPNLPEEHRNLLKITVESPTGVKTYYTYEDTLDAWGSRLLFEDYTTGGKVRVYGNHYIEYEDSFKCVDINQ